MDFACFYNIPDGFGCADAAQGWMRHGLDGRQYRARQEVPNDGGSDKKTAAVADLSKAMSLAPAGIDVAASYFVRSEAYAGLKGRDRACTDYSKAVKFNAAVVELLKTNQPIEAKPPKCD